MSIMAVALHTRGRLTLGTAVRLSEDLSIIYWNASATRDGEKASVAPVGPLPASSTISEIYWLQESRLEEKAIQDSRCRGEVGAPATAQRSSAAAHRWT